MPTFSNNVIIAGQEYALGGDIRVINFKENLDYSFIDPVGGECAPTAPGAAPTGPAIPGLNVAAPTGEGGGRRRWSYRTGMSERTLAGLDHNGILNLMKTVVTQAVLHHDGTYHSHQCFNVLCSRGLSTHFMVNHDGGVIQGMDPMFNAYHAGDSNMASVGIDMNNIATVEGHQNTYPDPAFGGVADYATRQVVEGRCNSSMQTSFVYNEAQYVSLAALFRLFNQLWEFPLIFPQDENGEVVRTRLADPHSFIGFYGHWHCQAGKWDPGPGFDWLKVMELLHGKSNNWPVDLGVGTLRELRSQQAVNDATALIFRNIEEGPAGGCFPVGLNQEWHDGVHLYAEVGTPVHSCSEGEIILTRNGPELPLGSPNYVLMRHRLERQRVEYDAQGAATIVTDMVWWYSLYMHLQRHRPNEVPEPGAPVPTEPVEPDPTAPPPRDVPPWYRRLVDIAREQKGRPLEIREDYELAEAQANPRQFEERARGLLRIQEFRHAYQCIEDGNPFRWVVDPNNLEEHGIQVGAGELLGYMGEYGEFSMDRIQKQPLLHFQIFSNVPIFDDTRFDTDTWRRLQGDLSGNSLAKLPEIIVPIQGSDSAEEAELEGPRLDFGRGRVLTPSEIDRFFKSATAEDRARFRTYIAQHMSEWDIAVDDSLTASVPILWPWQTDEEFLFWRALHVGYKWLNDDTRDLVGMIEGPIPIYTYHPIYLLGWWALNYGRAIQGQTFDGLEGAELQAALEAEQQNECTDENPENCDVHIGEEEAVATVNIEDMEDFVIRYQELDDLENGEWPPEIDFRNPLDRRR